MENEEKKTENAEETEKVAEAETGTDTEAEGQGDSKEGSNAPEKAEEGDGKKKQSRAENSYYAKLRRAKEELEAENGRLKAENEGYRANERKSITDEALANLGLDREDLNDPKNMRLAKLYAEASAKGEENPTAYAYRRFRTEEREAREKDEAEAKAKADSEAEAKRKTDEAFKSFTDKYGKDAFNSDLVSKDSLFMKKYGDVVTPDNLMKLYSIYADDVKAEKEKAKDNGTFDTSDDGSTAPKKKYAEDFPEFN